MARFKVVQEMRYFAHFEVEAPSLAAAKRAAREARPHEGMPAPLIPIGHSKARPHQLPKVTKK